jgi:ubiquinol-cytochrome c reductase cytochrome b subunit
MAAITAYSVFWFAAGNDIMAIKLGLSINDITWFFRIGLFVLPPLMFWVTKRICLSLQRRDRDTVLHGRETGTIVRTPDGQYFERHEVSAELAPEQWVLVQHEAVAPIQLEASVDENGVARKAKRSERLRAGFSRFYFADAVNPVTPAEFAAAQHHGAEHEAIEPSASGGERAIEAAEDTAEVDSGEPAGRH